MRLLEYGGLLGLGWWYNPLLLVLIRYKGPSIQVILNQELRNANPCPLTQLWANAPQPAFLTLVSVAALAHEQYQRGL